MIKSVLFGSEMCSYVPDACCSFISFQETARSSRHGISQRCKKYTQLLYFYFFLWAFKL